VGLGQTSTTSFPSLSVASPSISHVPTATFAVKSCPTRSGISYLSSPRDVRFSSTEGAIVDGTEVVDNNTPGSNGPRPRISRLPRSPFGSGQGTGIVSLLRTNIIQEGKSDLSPPRPPRYPFLNSRNRWKSKSNESEGQSAEGPSFFTSVNAESTPPSRRERSTASDDMVTRAAPWSQLRIGRRGREPSPSIASNLTEPPLGSP
jgi:protein SFI1